MSRKREVAWLLLGYQKLKMRSRESLDVRFFQNLTDGVSLNGAKASSEHPSSHVVSPAIPKDWLLVVQPDADFVPLLSSIYESAKS